jgi:hypothetical protein
MFGGKKVFYLFKNKLFEIEDAFSVPLGAFSFIRKKKP